MQSGMSFGKSSEVINIQKSGNLIKAHTAAAENLFFRGSAIQIEPIKDLDVIAFISSHKVDANITDTLENEEIAFSSIQGTGMHRTESELLDKNVILQNLARGTINLMPISLDTNELNVNIIADIAKCHKGEVVNSLMGDTISIAVRRKLSTGSHIIVKNDCLLLSLLHLVMK